MRSAAACIVLVSCGDPEVVFGPDAEWPPPAQADFASAAIFVVNGADDTMSVLAVEPLREIARVPIGLVPVQAEGPLEIAASPMAKRLYVSLSNDPPREGTGPHESHAAGVATDGYVLALSLEDGLLDAEARVDPLPGDLAVLPDGTVLQSHFDLPLAIRVLHREKPREEADTTLELIDGVSMQVRRRVSVCPAPSGIAVARSGDEAYLACYGNDEVSVVDLEGDPREVVRVPVDVDPRFAHPYYGPRLLAISPVDGRVWVSCWMEEAGSTADGEVRVFDPARRAFVDAPRVAHPGNPMQGAFDASGSRLYVPFRLADLLAVVDPSTGDDLVPPRDFSREECLRAHTLALSPDEATLYLLCEGDHVGPGRVLALDAETLETKEEVTVGVWPTDLEYVD